MTDADKIAALEAEVERLKTELADKTVDGLMARKQLQKRIEELEAREQSAVNRALEKVEEALVHEYDYTGAELVRAF